MSNTPLETIIKQRIRENGPMNMGEYMGLCLGHPDHGYYMTRDPFGVKGDFTTAPEISQMFGEVIGAWIADSWIKMGEPEKFALVECGAGRGTLMADILRATKNLHKFQEAVQIHIIETSPVLKKMQKNLLAQYKVIWHNNINDLPKDCSLMVIGNEFLDALPVRQLIYHASSWKENMVDLDINDTLRLHEYEADNDVLNLLPPFLFPPSEGARIEVSPEQKCFMHDLVKTIINQSGIALFVDYGFIDNVAGDTLQAVKDHAYCDILYMPGEADITAHVNFAEISQIAMEGDVMVHGPVTQSDYLNRIGLSIRADLLKQKATNVQRREIDAAVKRLAGKNTKENDMGVLFKVIALSSNMDIKLEGFS